MSWITERTLNWLQSLALRIIKTGRVPSHVAFIMDGNRRFADKQNMEKKEGHSKGFEKLSETLHWCMDLGVTEVTVYAFSIENFKRSKKEVDELMDLARQKFKRLLEETDKLTDAGVCVRVIGNLSLVPEDIRKLIARAIFITKDNNKAFLNLAFSYTSRDELTHALKDIAKGIKHADILPEDVTEDLISDCLYTYKSSNPELLIRTSGEFRLSDFLMWQISNSCIYFTNVLWPEFSIWHFLSAVFYYQRCYSDLQRIRNNLKPIAHNSRASMFVKKLHREREIEIEKIYLSAVQS
ncbi:dehydrodolichyl diphosphate synthase complex subunit DHDDS [Solenopsis invicta]|uniref:dehydrodolichyl diphosphate synthase complex subunit DHDDS n=1 Tax=Solenopsis invicta TaxID=13686 RepID=UPI0005958EB0|nr:dehydrodolichyl diphosphate synthase complex subunit DHDDS [Solenopsis invicta]XP_039310600.1 dehydrodolichyl diphosphate synthase complex subunit DHDDS [Solenopsis invicta]